MTISLRLVAIFGAVFATLPGCSQIEAEPAAPSLADAVRGAQQRMHARFEAVVRLEGAIVHSDLPRAHTEAKFIASLEEPDVLATWRPYIEGIRVAAHQIETTSNITAAARTFANLGQRCGQCHVASKAKVTFRAVPRPVQSSRLAPEMASHQWAASRMWEGLIGPSDDHWLDGARTLATAPLAIVAEGGDPGLGIGDDVARVRLLAKRALETAPSGRAALYGDLLATCVHCHAIIRDR